MTVSNSIDQQPTLERGSGLVRYANVPSGKNRKYLRQSRGPGVRGKGVSRQAQGGAVRRCQSKRSGQGERQQSEAG